MLRHLALRTPTGQIAASMHVSVHAARAQVFQQAWNQVHVGACGQLQGDGVFIEVALQSRAGGRDACFVIHVEAGIDVRCARHHVDSVLDGNARHVQRHLQALGAIIDAGQKRARPIVMTTIAMAAGMVPSALAFGAGGEFRSPMALAVIGGLIFSTLLSLIFVPAMFLLMDDVGQFFVRLGRKVISSSDEHDDEPPAVEHKQAT